MRFERITDTAHGMYGKALELYRASFPQHEQREAASQAAILREEEYQFRLIFDGDSFVGLLLCWETDAFLYVEHFCIVPELRNRRYGQTALALLGREGKKVILEIDPPVQALSRRRREFYKRCGFAENPYPHIHPPYHRGSGGHALVVLSYPAPITAAEYAAFSRYLTRRVMAGAWQ